MDAIIVKGEKDKTFEIDLKNPLQRRYEMVRELNLSGEKKEDIGSKYGYTRKAGHQYLRSWRGKSFEGLMDKPRGPKSKSKRTEDVERRILEIRFKDPEKDMYEITDILKAEGHEISASTIARVLRDHGVTLKKRRKNPFQNFNV
jgi:transposase